MTEAVRGCRRPWNIDDKRLEVRERKNPPAYMWKSVAEVCLHCTKRDCNSYLGCDAYRAAMRKEK